MGARMINYETLLKFVKNNCVHEWISGRYMVKHCKKCGVLSHD
jgi:hypothetical protein